MVVPAGILADRAPAQGTLALLSPEKPQNLFPITQLVLHPFDSDRFPLQLVLRIEGAIRPR